MKKIESFFLHCSGASQAVLNRCPTEKSKYVGVGATIFFTGLLAAISSGYALYVVFDSIYYAVPFGLIWGLMIFNLDRYIVLSMRKRSKWYKEYLQAFPRIVLAILIALVISKPLELKIFQKEISTELELLKEEIVQEQQQRVQTRFANRLDSMNNAIGALKGEIKEQTGKRNELMIIAQQEADGTGGTGKRNPGPIYRIKKADADRAQLELEKLKTTNEAMIGSIYSDIDVLNKEKQARLAELAEPITNGLSFQLTALHRLGEKYATINIASWFIVLLFIALELAPILTKLISNRGPYDDLIDVHEHHFKNYKKEVVAVSDIKLEKRLANV